MNNACKIPHRITVSVYTGTLSLDWLFFVRSISGPDQLRTLADGTIIKELDCRLTHLDFRTLNRGGLFDAAFEDRHYELWDGSGLPTLLRNLGNVYNTIKLLINGGTLDQLVI